MVVKFFEKLQKAHPTNHSFKTLFQPAPPCFGPAFYTPGPGWVDWSMSQTESRALALVPGRVPARPASSSAGPSSSPS